MYLFGSNMEWTDDHDHSLCQEILALEPFKTKKGSIARGQIWEKIARSLNSLKIPRFKVNKRSVRERYTLLIEKLKKKLKEEKEVCGIHTDMSDVEKALEEILEKEADTENSLEVDQKKEDNVKAGEMRNRAMESMRSTQKRKDGDEVEDVENAQPKRKVTRKSGGDTVAYLREKNDMDQKWKAEELKLQMQRLDVKRRKQDESQKQHQELMQMMAQQVQQQQNQMQQFQQMFAAMQQQQSQIILRLLEKH
ncbi:hypothetical protein AWC38_SpisGene19446 [Stylophora pistillata]|uniref:Myb/SANT-like DNA-binding domain-containing protein n=2 Tax=Stylophora pistillata TaxID=50429 RepID=A0A2B4RD57_STYPI|nr:hypothetical protein AWC38_SpisGene19446 [Stylophora pistillata]